MLQFFVGFLKIPLVNHSQMISQCSYLHHDCRPGHSLSRVLLVVLGLAISPVAAPHDSHLHAPPPDCRVLTLLHVRIRQFLWLTGLNSRYLAVCIFVRPYLSPPAFAGQKLSLGQIPCIGWLFMCITSPCGVFHSSVLLNQLL